MFMSLFILIPRLINHHHHRHNTKRFLPTYEQYINYNAVVERDSIKSYAILQLYCNLYLTLVCPYYKNDESLCKYVYLKALVCPKGLK